MKLRQRLHDYIETRKHIRLCDSGIAALTELYGPELCPEDDFEPACIGCIASRLVRLMQKTRRELVDGTY